MTKHVSHSLEETAQIAQKWLQLISEKNATNKKGATIIGLSGHLGAGKTAFTKCVAKDIGITEDVTSPTFVIMKMYPVDKAKMVKDLLPNFPWKKLIHIDAYRLEQGKELAALKFAELVKDLGNLILIEWPENVKEVVEKLEGYSQINFSVGDKETERLVEF